MPDLVADAVATAFRVARSGKPGPVLLDLPRDVLDATVEPPVYIPAGRPARPAADRSLVDAAAAALAAAERPIVIAGGGSIAADAAEPVRRLAECLALPVLTSLAGRGIIPDDHPLSAGGLGAHRNRRSKQLLAEADVVARRRAPASRRWRRTGCPASSRQPDATYIQIDIDPAEIGRGVPAQIGIVGDAAVVTDQLVEALRERSALLAPGAYREEPRTLETAAAIDELRAEVGRVGGRRPVADAPAGGDPRAVRRGASRATAIVAIDVGCPRPAHGRGDALLRGLRAAQHDRPLELLRDGLRGGRAAGGASSSTRTAPRSASSAMAPSRWS